MLVLLCKLAWTTASCHDEWRRIRLSLRFTKGLMSYQCTFHGSDRVANIEEHSNPLQECVLLLSMAVRGKSRDAVTDVALVTEHES